MNNRFLQDTSLSLQAKGLLAEILSNKSDWRIYLTELEKRSTNGASSHRAAFRELKHKKYAALFRKSKGYKKGFEIYCNYQGAIKSDGDLKNAIKFHGDLKQKFQFPFKMAL